MSKLITKNGQTVKALAAQFMLIDVNSRIPRIEDFSNSLGVGRGTIQTALSFLQSEGAIQLEANGHLGTKLTSVNSKKLWSIAGFTNIVAIMPLPYSKRYEGLATALCETFEQADIPFSLVHQRGSRSRILGVKTGRYDFAICSRLSAENIIESDNDLEISVYLGPHTFVGGHALILRPGVGTEIVDGMKIAVDPSSIDQIIMTQHLAAFKNVELIRCSYNQVIDMLHNNSIDATIWNADEFDTKFSQFHCLKVDLQNEKFFPSTEAVLVCRKDNAHIKTILHEIAQPEKIQSIQKLVLTNQKLPRY